MGKQQKNYSRQRGKKLNGHNTKFNRNHKNKSNKNENSGPVDRKRKNFKFIKRSKEAEENQRRQKITEDKYKKQTSLKLNEESGNESELETEEDHFDQLLSTFEGGDGSGTMYKAIDSSSDEDIEEEGEDEEESLDGEEEDDSGSIDEEGELDEELDDEKVEEETIGEEEEDTVEEEAEEDESENDQDVDHTETNVKDLSIIDCFSIHLDRELSESHVANLLSKPPQTKKYKLTWKELGNLQVEISKGKDSETSSEPNKKKKKILLSDEDINATEGEPPVLFDIKQDDLVKYQIKMKIQQNIAIANDSHKETDEKIPLTRLQSELFSVINNYQDIFYAKRNLKNAEEVRFVYCLHALNHMTKTRSKILHHNAKLTAAAAKNKKATAIIPDAYRDQGLVRPKVLIVVPFRESAYRVMNIMIKLMFGKESDSAKTNGSVINYKRFLEEFTGDTIYFPKTTPKPEDYENTFAGNTDDTFRIGLSLTKKCMKLYTEFYSSDILIASPLGLRMIVGASGDAERDYDFLTSIELLVLDQAELFFAQNWDHMIHVLDHMHLQPKAVRSTDFSRVRPWCLNGLSKFYRQTLLFTSHELPEFRSLFNSKCANYRGKVRVVNPVIGGSIRNVIVQIPQIFHKIDISSLEGSFDSRFKYFVNEILPQFKSPSMAHCMIYIPSYFDFVRIRNYFKAETINSVQICEYTTDAKIARARDMFYHSAAHFLLYSERAHFFRRTRVKGVRHLIMYQPPNWPNLYPELINLMQESNQNPRDGLDSSMSVTILYSKYDMLQVSSIIGTDRASKILQTGKTTHMFMTGTDVE